MQSLCALARSSAFMPAVFLLHIAILLSGLGGAADRHVFMNALRSSPFMSAALSLQVFIFCCCGVIVAALVSAAGVSAANAGPQANIATKPIVSAFFMGVSGGFGKVAEGMSFRASLRHADCPKQRFRRSGAGGCRIFLSCTATCAAPVSR